MPAPDGVNVTEQLPDTRVQAVELNDPEGPVSEKVTVPVGVIGPVEVSVMDAVQLEAWLTMTELGEQLTLVDDVCWPTNIVTTSEWTSCPAVALIVTL